MTETRTIFRHAVDIIDEVTYKRGETIGTIRRYNVYFEGEHLGWVVTNKRNSWQSYRRVESAPGQPTGPEQYTREDATMALLRFYGSFPVEMEV